MYLKYRLEVELRLTNFYRIKISTSKVNCLSDLGKGPEGMKEEEGFPERLKRNNQIKIIMITIIMRYKLDTQKVYLHI